MMGGPIGLESWIAETGLKLGCETGLVKVRTFPFNKIFPCLVAGWGYFVIIFIVGG